MPHNKIGLSFTAHWQHLKSAYRMREGWNKGKAIDVYFTLDQSDIPVGLAFVADRLDDSRAKGIIDSGLVSSSEDAAYFSAFFWRMYEKVIVDHEAGLSIPCEGSAEFWLERIYNSGEGSMLRTGYEQQWDEASDAE